MAKKSSSQTQTEWNLQLITENDSKEAFAKEREAIQTAVQSFVKKWKNREDYLQNPAVLLEALDEYEQLNRTYGSSGNQGYYIELKSTLNQADPELKAQENLLDEFARAQINELSFFDIRVAKIPAKEQKKFITYKPLAPYKHFLERLFTEASLLLSEDEEKIMTLKVGPAYHNWVRMTESFLSKEERKVKTETGRAKTRNFSEITNLLNNKNKQVRDSAAKAFNDILAKHVEVAEAEINAILQNKKTDDTLRKLDRPDRYRHIGDDIETETVDALLEAVLSHYEVAKDYYKLKAALLGKQQLAYHERSLEYGEVKQTYTYPEGSALVHKVVGNIDPEFNEIFTSFEQNGQIDVYPKKGKRSGAACWHNIISQPSYILLNYTDRLYDVMTLAHELGHGINNELMRKKQNALSFSTPTSTAEVASIFLEDYVLQEILKNASEEERLSLYMSRLNEEISSCFRQVACYKFEQDLHAAFREKGYVSYQEIGQIFRKNMEAYMGPAVEQSEGSQNWWVYWSHIRTFFYVYSYASGTLIAKALQAGLRKDEKFIENIKFFLSAGTSLAPRDIFLQAGIDIADKQFWLDGVGEIRKTLQETEKLAKKLGKLS